MARQEFKVQANNFTGGFITEASPLSFPENSCLDILNMDINIDGSVERRTGLIQEPNPTQITTPVFPTGYDVAVTSYVWRNAGGIDGNNYVVVQDGYLLRFFAEQDSLSEGYQAGEDIDLMLFRVLTSPTLPEDNFVSIADVRGYLVVTARNLYPFYVDYDSGDFTTRAVTLQARDLEGIEDGLPIDERPSDMSDEHYYNLLNQGWDSEKIELFRTDIGRYPSNADIWSVGRDANNDFSPDELVKIDFGTSRAPLGKFIHDVFDTQENFVQLFGTYQEPTVIGAAPVINNTTIELTIPGHGYTNGQTVYIWRFRVRCGTFFDTYRIDGEYAVQSATTNTFRVTIVPPKDGYGNDVLPVQTIRDLIRVHGDYVFVEDFGFVTVERPTAVASFAGRVWYAGTQVTELTDKVYFSQMVLDQYRIGRCYSSADPTSEIDSDIVATDGGVITINGLGSVLDMRVQQDSLVVFSTNGVWEIAGDGDDYFSATGYRTRKITSVPALSARGIVDIEGSLMFMGEDGIYALSPNEITSRLQPTNLTATSIKSYYIDWITSCRCNARAVYDYKERRVLFLHGQPIVDPSGEVTVQGGGLVTKRLVLSNALVLNLDTQSFTKYVFPFGWGEPASEDTETTVRIMDAIAIRNTSAPVPCVRYIYRYYEWVIDSYTGSFKTATDVDAATFSNNFTMEFTIAGHGYVDGQTVYIENFNVRCGSLAYWTIDGLYVIQNATTDTFRVSIPVTVCPTIAISTANGYPLVYDNFTTVPESRIGFLMQGGSKSVGMEDAGVSEVLSYVYTGHATLGDVGVKKIPRQLILHMLRTEAGFTVDGETFTPIHPSGVKVSIAWDFTSDIASNKWQPEFQGYRYRQFDMPSGTGPTHVGYDVVTSKTKLRGNGRAFSMRFNSEPGKDMNILGWSITGSVEGNE